MSSGQSSTNPSPELSGPRAFFVPLQAFLAAMETARDLEQFVQENQSDVFGIEAVFTRIATRLMPSVDIEQHRRAAKIIHKLIHERMDATSALEDSSPEEVRAVRREFSRRINDAVTEATGRQEDNYHYSTVWRRTTERPSSGPILGAAL